MEDASGNWQSETFSDSKKVQSSYLFCLSRRLKASLYIEVSTAVMCVNGR